MSHPEGAAEVFEDEDDAPYEYIPLTDEEKTARDAFVASVREVYDTGRPLFTKEMIRLARDQMVQSPPLDDVHLLGFDGHTYSLPFAPTSLWKIDGRIRVPVLRYRSFEDLTSFRPYGLEEMLFISVEIAAISNRDSQDAPDIQQVDVRSAFDKYFDLWAQGTAWARIQGQIRRHLPSLPKTIDKIIGFGLGEITTKERWCGGQPGKPRSCCQHSLMLTLATMMEEYTGTTIKCYAQDPAYYATCEAVLGERGIEVLQDEAGFLLVDANSIVLSFAPNIPVRQIIADLTRPAMMIWDSISEPRISGWKRADAGYWVSPYSTDPSSPRVLAMGKEYVELSIEVDTETLGNVAVYVRKATAPRIIGDDSASM